MRLLIITAMFPPVATGTSFYSKNLAEALKAAGHSVLLVTTRNNNADTNETYSFPVNRIKAWHFPLKNFFKHLRFCSLIPSNYTFIRRIAKEYHPDAIILINHYLDIVFPTIFAARITRAPLYISIGTQLQSLNKFRNRILRFSDRLIVGRFILPSATRIVSWDREIERYITEVHRKKNYSKSIIIPFGVNGDLKKYDSFYNDYNDTKQILGVGAIIGHRDYIYQLKVFAELAKDYPDLIFKIIGNQYIDRPRKYVEQLGLSTRVQFTGEIPHDKVLNEYKKSFCHWMMLNGEYVGLGTSTLEAMLMGIPVVSNVPENLFGFGELKDMLSYIRTDGLSIETDVKKLKQLIENQQQRRTIGQNGREFVKKHLNWQNVAQQYISMIEEDNTLS